MATDSSEPTRHKNRSSSPDDGDDLSRRHKHRHRHHHRHRSKKDKEETKIMDVGDSGVGKLDEIEVNKLELEDNGNQGAGSVGEVFVSTGSAFVGFSYDMEEGEILEDDGLVNGVDCNSEKLKNLDSDVESGEIEANGYCNSDMGINEENVERADMLRKLGQDHVGSESGKLDQERASSSEALVNGYAGYTQKYERDGNSLLCGDGKKSSKYVEEVGQENKRRYLSSEKRKRDETSSHSCDSYPREIPHSNISKSPEASRERSQSRSVLRDSVVGTPGKKEDHYYADTKNRSDSDDERTISHERYYRHVSIDYARDKDRDNSCSRNVDGLERHYARETHDKYREERRERYWDRDLARENERYREGSRERDRERDSIRDRERDEDGERIRLRHRERDRGERERERGREKEKERERDRPRDRNGGRTRERDWERESGRGRDIGRERELDKVRVKEDSYRERERGKEKVTDGGRARSRDRELDEGDRASKRQKYGNYDDGSRDRVSDSRHKSGEDIQRHSSKRSDLEKLSSKSNIEDMDNESWKREDEQEDYQERIVMQLAAEQEEDDLERIKEESRRRKQAILEKYKYKQQQNETRTPDMVKGQVGRSPEVMLGHTDTRVEALGDITVENSGSGLDSTDIYDDEPDFAVGKSPLQSGPSALERPAGTGGLGEGSPKSERSGDMFSDDIFGESPAGVRKTGRGDGAVVEKSGVHDNWDDAEGYYGYRFGETLDGRYEIIAAHGKGVFSTVVRSKDLKAKPGEPEEVAIKIIRNNETMYKAGMEELVILRKLVGADPENKRHCVRFLSTFKYRNHLCLVFESLHMNLREVLKKFGRNIGLKLTAVRTYAKQLFIALKHLKNCGVLHSDIKPDNMLVNEAKNMLKLCDFGNAMFAGKNEITPYLVSRFYRAPEIILGLPYDHPMDIWSVGCCLFEIYTGKVLFPGSTNNDMLRLHMELKGPFPKKMLRKGGFTDQHFDHDLNFLSMEEDPVTKKAIRRLMVNIKPKDFSTLISGFPGEDPKMVANFRDLLEKIFVLDPDKRLNVSQALSHPFITGK